MLNSFAEPTKSPGQSKREKAAGKSSGNEGGNTVIGSEAFSLCDIKRK